MLKVYNTLTKRKETFKPLDEKKVGMYVCGVTVYDFCHIGHARTYLSMDIIIRYLRFRGYKVHHVRNITDIDDKIIKRANESKIDYNEVTARFIKAMHEDFAALNLSFPDDEPRATDYIPQMVTLIEKIIAHDQAYVASNGDVYFDVRRFPDYGRLSHHNLENLESGARVEVNIVKRDPLDFVLWKLAKPNEPSWDSPWGKGRPGWHIECSAMAIQLLGEHFDIHGGGRDLIFPHHENEIAQSEAATRKKFANYWLHGGFLQIEKEKMSKSLGNFITIREVLANHSPEVVRYFLSASHYRSPLIYTEELLYQAKQSLGRLYTALRLISIAAPIRNTQYEQAFIKAMDDDFNTPVALAVLFDLAHEVQRLREKEDKHADQYAALLRELGNVLGVLQTDPEEFFKAASGQDSAKIDALIAARQKARAEKNWAEADRIRNELAKMSITIEDTATGTTWKSNK